MVGRSKWLWVFLSVVLGVTLLVPASGAGADGVKAAFFENVIYDQYVDGSIGAVSAGDLNGDGRTDVVAATATDSSFGHVVVFYQNASHQLGAPVEIDGSSRAVRVADVNGDGRADLIALNLVGVNLRLQLPDGTLAPVLPVAVAGVTGRGEVGDYDKDGRTDVAVIRVDGSVALLRGQANGTLASPTTLATFDFQPSQVRFGDLDGDARTDVAIFVDHSIYLRNQLANGQLDAGAVVTQTEAIRDFVLGDFNGDGRTDLATSRESYGHDHVIYRNSDLTWGAPIALITPGPYSTSLRAADVDLDGKLDLVSIEAYTDMFVHLQGPSGLDPQQMPIAPQHSTPQQGQVENGWVADINSDGWPDLISSSYFSPLSVSYNTTATTRSGLEGTVTATGGAPLSGITVDAFGPSGNLAATTTTNGAGHYELSFHVLDPDVFYTLRFTDPSGTRPTAWYAWDGPTNGRATASGSKFALGASTIVNLTIPAPATATGTVVDGHGTARGGLKITATARGAVEPTANTTTAGNGTFTVTNLLAGFYDLTVSDPSGTFETEWIGAPGKAKAGAAPERFIAAPTTALGSQMIGAAGCATTTFAPGANLNAKVLTGCDRDGATLAGASLVGTDLAGSRLRSADLTGATLNGTDLTRVNLLLARFGGSTRTAVEYSATTCPDGTSSDAHGDTCEGHLANPVGSDNPIGAMDISLADGGVQVTGWALDPNVLAPVAVRVTVDGGTPVDVIADRSSAASVAAQPKYGGNHGFYVGFPTAVVPPGVHEICARVTNVGPGSDTTIGCRVFDTPVRYTHYTTLAPERILDTRDGTGAGGSTAPMSGRSTIDLKVTGRAGVPSAHVGAVVLNVTVVGPTAPSFLTLWPTLTERPTASNLNVAPGQTAANLVVARVGANGKVSIFNNAGDAHVIADIAGYYDDAMLGGASYEAAPSPVRVLDTRDGTGTPAGALGAGKVLHLQVGGANGVPAGATSVALNLTATDATESTFLTAYPSGPDRPAVSNLNLGPGQTVANMVIAKVSPDGRVDIYNRFGSVNVIADVAGWFDEDQVPSVSFNPLSPQRVLDTRDGTGAGRHPIDAGATIHVRVAGVGGVPAEAKAVVLNVTAADPTAASFFTVFPTGTTPPTASNLNFAAGQIVPNLVIARVSPDGYIDIYNRTGQANAIADVSGWFA